jgi:hypothetical protein
MEKPLLQQIQELEEAKGQYQQQVASLEENRILEVEKRIQSAELVFELAEQAGRLPSRAEKMSFHDETTRTAIQSLVRRRDTDLER